MKKNNKKHFKPIYLLIPIILIAIVGIYHLFTYKHYSYEAKIVKQLLIGLSEGASQYNKKSYEISFKEKYDVESKSSKDLSENDFAISYEGEGSVKLSYNISKSDKIDSAISNLVEFGNGYLTGVQKEKLTYYNKEDTKNRVDDIKYDMDHEFIIKVDDNDYYAVGNKKYTDYNNSKNNLDNSFYGKIDKEIFKNTVSDERMKKSIEKLMYMDTWKYIEQLSSLSNNVFKDWELSNAKSVNTFIKNHEIKIEEEENSVNVRFSLDTAKIASKLSDLEKDFSYLPKIYGKMKIEKETGNVLHFEYDLSNYLLAIFMKSGEDKPYYKANVEEFIIEGKVLNTTLEDLTIDKKFTEYYEENKLEFLKQFQEHVIPNNIVEG